MTTITLIMTDDVLKGFNHLPESSTFFCFSLSAQASLTAGTRVGHSTIEKSLVGGGSV